MAFCTEDPLSRQVANPLLPPPVKRLLFDHADQQAFRRLTQLLIGPHRQAAALVGAGTSQALGYPTWSHLLGELHVMARKVMDSDSERRDISRHFRQIRKCDDITWRAQEYRDAIADERRYQRFLKQTFKPRRGRSAVLETLVQLPFRHFLTTNYDCEIERAYERVLRSPLASADWMEEDQAASVVSSWSDPAGDRKCVYLRGRFDRPESIVLTEADYQHAYFKMRGNAQRLSSILLLHPIVFLGFSLSDPDLMALLRQANTLGFPGARHFALIGLSSQKEQAARFLERARLRRKFGVAAIFFRPGAKYDGLRALLQHICDVAREERQPEAPETPPRRITESYVWAPNRLYPDDRVKGRFGGSPERGNWRLSAIVKRDAEDPYWFNVKLSVGRRPGYRRRLRGQVDFFMHDSFQQFRYWSRAKNGVATFEFGTYGSFTLGALVHQDKTHLELDLAEIDGAPLDFQMT